MRSLIARAAATYEPRGLPLSVGRSLIAAAQLSVVLLAPDDALFFRPGTSDGVRCDGAAHLSLWCVTGGDGLGAGVSRAVTIAVLILTAIGYRPRWTCLPHWYVSSSLAVSMTVPNGGDQLAQVATILLIPLCIADRRTWSWRLQAEPLDEFWRGSALAGHLMLRLQMAALYLGTASAKLHDPAWRRGDALYFVAQDPRFGLPDYLKGLVLPAFNSHLVVAVATWAVIGVQVAMALAVLGASKARRGALVLGVGLHGSIAAAMGLWSFSLIVVGFLVIAGGGGSTERRKMARESCVERGQTTDDLSRERLLAG